MKMLHGSVTNKAPGRLRLSCDVRFQPAADACDGRYTIGGSRTGSKFPSRRKDTATAVSMAEARVEWGIAPRHARRPKL